MLRSNLFFFIDLDRFDSGELDGKRNCDACAFARLARPRPRNTFTIRDSRFSVERAAKLGPRLTRFPCLSTVTYGSGYRNIRVDGDIDEGKSE